MTVSTTIRKAGPFTGNGATTVFPFAFKVFTAADVVATVATAGVESTLLLTTDYSVTLNPDQDANPGGSITTVVPLAVGRVLVLTSAVAQTQLALITNAGGFFPAVFNAIFDKAVILIQQLTEVVSRSVTIPKTATGVTSLQIPVMASAVLQWSADGTRLLAVTLPDLSLSLALPAQGGHNGHAFFSDGAAAGWRAIAITDVTGLQSAINYCRASVAQVPTLAQVRAAVIDGAAQAASDASSARTFAVAASLVF